MLVIQLLHRSDRVFIIWRTIHWILKFTIPFLIVQLQKHLSREDCPYHKFITGLISSLCLVVLNCILSLIFGFLKHKKSQFFFVPFVLRKWDLCLGNMDTLFERPKAKGVDTRRELIKFYDEHYSANLMHLVVYGKGRFWSI